MKMKSSEMLQPPQKKKTDKSQIKPTKRAKAFPKKYAAGGGDGSGSNNNNPPVNKKIIVKSQGEKWFKILESEQKNKQVPEIPVEDEEEVQEPLSELSEHEISSIQAKAAKLLEADCQAYRQGCLKGAKRSDFVWMDNIMKTGTLPDKMAAFIVRVQDSPIHNLFCLQQLISMVKVQGRQQCLMTADTARDLFLEDLLPQGRKLISFESRGPKLRTATDKELIIWLFEHRLKLQYQNYIEALRKMSVDQVDKMRGKAIVILSQLLIAHPEQEQTLLQLLVNKLGDPVKKIASKTLFHLYEVLKKHPLMKLVIVQEVERLLFRTNVAKKAQYYGVCFLNMIKLGHIEAQLAAKLVNVYLAFFKACVKTGEIESKMMCGLLNGVNKAFPLAKMVGIEFSESLDTLFKIVQISHFSIGVQALSLLFHVIDIDRNELQANRFYNALYRKLMSDDLFSTAHCLQFVNLIFKAMKKDSSFKRVLGFTKRLLQVCSNAPPNVACGLLYLISEVSKVHKGIILTGAKLSKEIQLPTEEKKANSKLKNAKIKPIVDTEKLARTTNIRIQDEVEVKPEISIIAFENLNENNTAVDNFEDSVVEVKQENDLCHLKEYDPTARNPKFTGAELTFAYELLALSKHVHPSVALFASTLLANEKINYTGNPLKDFTVARFLARFVFRNPKPTKGHIQYQPAGLRNVPVNSNDYLQAKESEIPVEEKFFYKFYANQKLESKNIKKEKDDLNNDNESIDDEEFDSIMSNYFKTSGALDEVDEDDEELDFASVKEMSSKRKTKHSGLEEDEEESEIEEDDANEFAQEGSDDDEGDEFMQMDSEDEPEFEGSDADSDTNLPPGLLDEEDDDFLNYGKAAPGRNKRQKPKFGSKNTFAPAEQFSEILEANADMAFSGSHDLINKDNADIKQLKWEAERDRWVRGYKKHQGSGSGKPFRRNPIKKRKMN